MWNSQWKSLVDLDYDEDSSADVDANFIMTKKSGFSEIQISRKTVPSVTNLFSDGG